MSAIKEIKLNQIDPNPDQPRSSKKNIEKLAESIREVGLIHPVIVVEHEARYLLIDGHRRYEAVMSIAAGVIDESVADATITAIVVPDLERAKQAAMLMAANTVREDLTAIEEAVGIQTMVNLGIDVKGVALSLGRDKEFIELARKVAPNTERLFADLKGKQISMDEAAALVEFQDDKGKYKKLMQAVGEPDFVHVIGRLRSDREHAIKMQETIGELEAAGVRTKPGYYYEVEGVPLSRLDIEAEDHKDCPGHFAAVSCRSDIQYMCDKQELHGREVRGERVKTAEEIAEEKAQEEIEAAWEAANTVRLEHMNAYIAALKDRTLDGPEIGYIAGVAITSWLSPRDISEDHVSSMTASQLLLEMALARSESQEMQYGTDIADFKNMSNWVRRHFPAIKRHYDFLLTTGYVLAECEQDLYDATTAEPPVFACEDSDHCEPDECEDCDSNPANEEAQEDESA